MYYWEVFDLGDKLSSRGFPPRAALAGSSAAMSFSISNYLHSLSCHPPQLIFPALPRTRHHAPPSRPPSHPPRAPAGPSASPSCSVSMWAPPRRPSTSRQSCAREIWLLGGQRGMDEGQTEVGTRRVFDMAFGEGGEVEGVM